MNTKIKNIKGCQLFDCRGNPTVAAKVELESGFSGFFISPSGASTGEYEAHELRDGKKAYGGKGVTTAVLGINTEISDALRGQDAANQQKIDKMLLELDGTENKSRLGANAVLAVSCAVAKAAANAYKLPLYRYIGGFGCHNMPIPMMNILNGGAHAANNIDIQEFMIVPVGAESMAESIKMGTEIYHALGKMLSAKGLSCGVGDEGGFAPNLEDDTEAIELIIEAINRAGYSSDEIKIALDVAASEWARGEDEYVMTKSGTKLTHEQMIAMYKDLMKKYPIISIEDGLGENDWRGWERMTDILGNDLALVGDDLFVTNERRLKKGLNNKSANSILIKPNQIGTLSETLNVINIAKQHGYQIIVSHRSGDSEDTTIADLAVGVNATRIKTGAPARSERTAKYNRLLMIEEELKI